jgi:hypothetical protein
MGAKFKQIPLVTSPNQCYNILLKRKYQSTIYRNEETVWQVKREIALLLN